MGRSFGPLAGHSLRMRPLIRVLSYVLVFSIPLENAIGLPGIGTLARSIGLVVAGGWLASLAVTGRVRQPGPLHAVTVLLFAWNALTLLWTVDHALTVDRIQTYGQLVGMAFIFWDLYTTPLHIDRALHAYLAGAWGLIGAVLWSYGIGAEAGHLRYSGAGFNADDGGVILALGVPIAFHLLRRRDPEGARLRGLPRRLVRMLCWAYVPAALLAIGLTGTRTALLAAAPGLLFGLSLLPALGPRRASLAFATMLAGLLAVAPFVPATSLERLGSIGTEVTQGDLNGRLTIWAHGVDAFVARPVAGSGSGAFRVASGIDRASHNSFLSVLVEGGVIGFALFAALLGLAGWAALRHPVGDARFWAVLLVSWAIGASALTWEHRKQTWLLLVLTVTSAAAVREQREPPPFPRPS